MAVSIVLTFQKAWEYLIFSNGALNELAFKFASNYNSKFYIFCDTIAIRKSVSFYSLFNMSPIFFNYFYVYKTFFFTYFNIDSFSENLDSFPSLLTLCSKCCPEKSFQNISNSISVCLSPKLSSFATNSSPSVSTYRQVHGWACRKLANQQAIFQAGSKEGCDLGRDWLPE